MLKRRRKPKKLLFLFLIFVLIICIIFGVLYSKMRPIILRYAVSEAETIMLNAANNAVLGVLENENFSYDGIVNLSTDGEGYVTSLKIDIYEINILKSKIANSTNELIMKNDRYGFYIPFGTFLGEDLFTSKGPDIRFDMQLTSTVFVDFAHEFKAAGINQTLHTVKVNIKINGSLLVSGYNKPISVSTSVIAAQTVIVGNSPDAFTNVIENEDDNTAGLINDYGSF